MVSITCRRALALFAAALVATAEPRSQISPAPEVSTREESAVFQSKVTLIEVPVVVRDKDGKPVGTLRQEDFQLFDRGKPQIISRFSVEKAEGGKTIPAVSTAGQTSDQKADTPAVLAPDHFVGLLFDDVHTSFENQVQARVAAQKFVASGLKANDRAAIFTTSGQLALNFTDDRDLLYKTLMKLAPHPMTNVSKCPAISLYQAELITNVHDALAIGVAIGDYEKCFPETPYPAALQAVTGLARQEYQQGRQETAATMVNIKGVIGKMAEMPGQRTLILASPGFYLMDDQHDEEGSTIDRAIRSGVVINALDVQGLVAPMTFDAENPTASPGKEKLNTLTAMNQSGVLEELTSGTGGKLVRNANDLFAGLRKLGEAPEVFYLLGFSPQNLRLDGKFHSLKVEVKTPAGLSGLYVEARRGYYAPTHLATAEEDAKEEISQALFSRDEMNDIPVGVNTRFFKASESEARLTVTSRVDVRKLHFRKSDDRNMNSVRIVCALFDRDGNFVQADAKTIEMSLLDATLQDNKLSDGIPIRSDFTVPPGTYVIRLVLRDAEGQTMTAQNNAVKIP